MKIKSRLFYRVVKKSRLTPAFNFFVYLYYFCVNGNCPLKWRLTIACVGFLTYNIDLYTALIVSKQWTFISVPSYNYTRHPFNRYIYWNMYKHIVFLNRLLHTLWVLFVNFIKILSFFSNPTYIFISYQ